MKVRVIRQRVTAQELSDMLEALGTYVKLAVDVDRDMLAGGGEYHADCEEVLLEEGSLQASIWGADWYPESHAVALGALINIRPRQGNMGMEIQDPGLRARVERIVRALFEGVDE